jgi:hypothetical protein
MFKKYAFVISCLIIILSWSNLSNLSSFLTKNEDLCVFVQDVYIGVLDRPADPEGLKFHCDLLKSKKIKKHELIGSLIKSKEFTEKKE